ncbi:MAG: AAA family ATPase [Myxococcales bacterium]|nr:AAA family ATPase [Myxococcales bacterium]
MLKSLEIKNFRMLEDFQVSKLGRVNLIVGKNNSGKSTVLEALRIYAGDARPSVLQQIAASHHEAGLLNQAVTIELPASLPFAALITDRRYDRNRSISIGELASESCLVLSFGYRARDLRPAPFLTAIPTGDSWVEVVPALQVTRGKKRLFLINLTPQSEPLSAPTQGLPCSHVPTQFVPSDVLADEWDQIALTDGQNVVREALQILAPEFEGLTFVRDTGTPNLHRSPRVKLSTATEPVPLHSLGDGVVRILQIVLKLFPAKSGFLLIDEFDNGLHYSVQEQVWSLIFKMAARLDIQVFATTHSWDCIESFARAAHANQDVEGVLFRVGRSVRTSDRGRTIATIFDEEQLYAITQTDVEVR